MPWRYDRAAAVAYANRWWNSYNPEFVHFPADDCTNYISQVLLAGGFPMEFTGQRDRGWWYVGGNSPGANWSFSWAVAHSLRWYLAQHPRVEPLVNAHTSNVRQRHWAYRDSPAWTPGIQYFFWHIRDR